MAHPSARVILGLQDFSGADYTARWKVTHWKSVNTRAFFRTNPEGAWITLTLLEDYIVQGFTGGLEPILAKAPF